jgi:hypothetical protein
MLVLKLLLVPGLVAIVTLGVRRWGPAVAGPVLVFYALEQGTPFAAHAAQATIAGLVGTTAFALAYGRSATRLAWYGCVAIGWSVFAATIAVLYWLPPGLVPSFLALVVAATLARRGLPAWNVAPGPSTVPPGDLPIRMGASATLVVVLTAMAAWLGSTWSGLLNAFPVLTTTIAAFTHAQQGSGAVVIFLRGYLRAVIGFGFFCVVLSVALNRVGLPAAVLLG